MKTINKNKDRIQTIYAISTMVGTIVGVGIFGLPYVAAQIGFIPMFFYLCGGAIIVLAVHLIYTQVILWLRTDYRLPGQVTEIFGKKWGMIAFINFLVGMLGSQLVYIIIGGKFLQALISIFSPISLNTAILIFFILGNILIYKDIKSIAETEFWMLLIQLVIILGLFIFSLAKIELTNFAGYDSTKLFLPYGIVIFSFWGTSIIPEIKSMFSKNLKKSEINKKLLFTNIISISISFFIYLAFIITILGVSGTRTSVEAFEGIKPFFSPKIIYTSYLFGFLCVFTSFLTNGLTIKKCFQLDYEINKILAFILSSSVPIFLYILNFRNFINIINFIGTITFGIAGIFMFSLYLELKRTKKIGKIVIANSTACAIIILFILGIIMSFKK